MPVTEREPRSEVQQIRCKTPSCRQPLPVRGKLGPGSVLVLYCRHCKRDTIVTAPSAPHWA